MAARITAIAALLLLGGCCLATPSEGASSNMGTSGGRQTNGGTTSGGTTGGDAGPDCTNTYCAPNFLCEPSDGMCRCGGQDCEGECEAGTCFEICPPDAGGHFTPILGGAYAFKLPAAIVGLPYIYQVQVSCGSYPNLSWEGFIPVEGLSLTASGVISGIPTEVSRNGPFEFQLRVTTGDGQAGVQNYLLEVVARDGGA